MKFPYRQYAVEPSPAAPLLAVISRPVIPVRFLGPKGALDCYALLDTGADESYVTESMAERLGIEPLSDEASTVHSASGEMSIAYGAATVEVTDGAERFSRPLVVGIVSESWSEAILGHTGFLEYFDATFSYVDQAVSLTFRGA